jgi:proteasome beta subunit
MEPVRSQRAISPYPGQTSAHSLQGDFFALLKKNGLLGRNDFVISDSGGIAGRPIETQATTVLAFKFEKGVLVAGDRRATAGNVLMYDRADKVLEIDPYSIMAIAGSPATAWEMARVLEHSFQFYRRSQLQEMSVEGKVRALSKLLRENLGMVMQGVGVVVPLFATYDRAAVQEPAKVFFYDAMGAQFEATDHAASGSGGPSVRSILYYENVWGDKPLKQFSEKEAILLALKALDTAAEADTATGGVDRTGRIYPLIKVLDESGIRTIPQEDLANLFRTV